MKNSDSNLVNLEPDLTQHERKALSFDHDLAAAHIYAPLSPGQQGVVNRLPEIWRMSEQMTQEESEVRFIKEFLSNQNQHHALDQDTSLLVYSCSIAMVMVTTYLKQKQFSLSVIEPCFDNLINLINHVDIPVSPLPEAWLYEDGKVYDNLEANVKDDAIFVVDPNNPTGRTWLKSGRGNFIELAQFCKDTGKLLVMDFSFAPFVIVDGTYKRIDVYEIMDKIGTSYIAVEDTGKIWPHMDTKVALMKCSPDLYIDMFNIYTTYLLNVSPFVLNLLTELILDSNKDSYASIRNLLNYNRNTLVKGLEGTFLEHQAPDVEVSVAWFKITNPGISATEFQKIVLKEAGLYILPGWYFYWNNPSLGENYVRMSIGRDKEIVKDSIQRLQHVLKTKF